VGKFSEEPGFRGGVGKTDYHIIKIFPFPTGVVDFLSGKFNQPPPPFGVLLLQKEEKFILVLKIH
jgi:hypothetical protein